MAKIKYASARIKLLRVDSNQERTNKTEDEALNSNYAYHQATTTTKNNKHGSPTSSATSTLGGVPHTRRLVEMLINEFYRKRGKSIKTVA